MKLLNYCVNVRGDVDDGKTSEFIGIVIIAVLNCLYSQFSIYDCASGWIRVVS